MWMKQSHGRKKTILPSRYSLIFKDYWMTKKALVAALMNRIKTEKDCFILISGRTGSGKSNLCGNLNWRCFANIENPIKKDGSKMFNDEQCFITDPDEFAYKMIKMEGQSLWMDEGRGIANRRKWYSKINSAVAERKNQNRKLFNIYWICMPFEKEFDPVLASHLTLWMWVRRGVAEIYVARGDIKGSEGLNIPGILEREEKWMKENPTRMIVPPTIHPEFIGRISFPKMPKKYDERYKELVRIKSGVGKVTEEEAKKFGIIVEEKPETTILNAIDKIKSKEINDKIALWAALEKIKGYDEDKKVKLLNFYLKMNNYPTFDKIFNQDKVKKSRMIKLD
jgi:hypothetical protein